MPTQTAAKKPAKPRAAKATAAMPTPEKPAHVPAAGQLCDVPIQLIAPSPYQPRDRADDPTALANLAQSVADWGIKQPIVVRRKGGGMPLFPATKGQRAAYELVAGERRLRAAHAAGLASVPAMVHEWTDDEARAFAAVENLQREDLTEWERARALKALADAGKTQAEIGRLVGLTQGAVSNLIRCLDLPAEWTNGTISQEMTPTHCRELVAYKDCPEVLGAIKHALKQRMQWAGFPPAKDFAELARQAAWQATMPMDRTNGSPQTDWHPVPVFKPTDEQRKQLALVPVKTPQGRIVERATNAKLWHKLQADHQAKWLQRRKAREGKTTNGKPAEPTAEELKAREQQRAEQFARQLAEWRAEWLRYLCWKALGAKPAKGADRWAITRCLMLLTTKSVQESTLDLAIRQTGGPHSRNTMKALAKCPKPDETATELVRLHLWANRNASPRNFPHGPYFDGAAVEQLARDLAIDLDAQWRAEQAGPMTERFYQICNRDHLVELATQWECHGHVTKSTTKAALVKLLSTSKCKPLPKLVKPL